MENLGEHLQEEREKQEISIQELSSLTRIPVRFIEAIEENRLDLLPNPVSAKGFLRSYADCLGLDHTLVAEFCSTYYPADDPGVPSEDQEEILSFLHVKKPIHTPFPRRVVLSVGGVILALIVMVGLLSNNAEDVAVHSPIPVFPAKSLPLPAVPNFSQEEPLLSEESSFVPEEAAALADQVPGLESDILQKDAVSDLAQDVSEIPLEAIPGGFSAQALVTDHLELTLEPSLESIIDRPTDSTDLSAAFAESVSEIDSGSEGGEKKHVLFLEALEASWVQVKIDGDEVREALLQPNDNVHWQANEKFLLTLGNAGGVRVQLDGQDLGSFGLSGEVVHKEILGKSAAEFIQ